MGAPWADGASLSRGRGEECEQEFGRLLRSQGSQGFAEIVGDLSDLRFRMFGGGLELHFGLRGSLCAQDV